MLLPEAVSLSTMEIESSINYVPDRRRISPEWNIPDVNTRTGGIC